MASKKRGLGRGLDALLGPSTRSPQPPEYDPGHSEGAPEAAVVAARDEEGLEKPKAYVVLQQDAEGDHIGEELKEIVKERIGKWKYPRWVEIVPELPKTATGKIQRFKLRSGDHG